MDKQAEMQERGNNDQEGPTLPCIFAGEVESTTEAEEGTNSFKSTFRRSITPVFSLLEDLIGRSAWDGHPIETHPLASEHEMASVLAYKSAQYDEMWKRETRIGIIIT
jgi:hypothetical protein